MAIKSEGSALAHPLYEALTALKTGQGDLGKVTHSVAVEAVGLPKGRHVLWNLYLAHFFTSYLSRAAKAARANKDKEELLRLQIKAVKARLKRDRLDLMQRHVCKEDIPGIWLHYHTGYFEPEWLLERKPEYLFRRDESFKHLLMIGAVQMAAGRSLFNPDAPELTGHPVFAELVSRFSELILDPLWEKWDIESHPQLELSYYARRFGPETVLDELCGRSISHSMLTTYASMAQELDTLTKIANLMEDLQGVVLNSKGLKDLLSRLDLLDESGSRDRDKKRYPKVVKDILNEVQRIRQLA